MAGHLQVCNGTYTRSDAGWTYPWGAPVPNATDLTLADLLAVDGATDCVDAVQRFRELRPAERRWLAGEPVAADQLLLRQRRGCRAEPGDLIIGMMAPELQVVLMLTAADISEMVGLSKATLDSYRYRGYLPRAQLDRGRTQLWARPIVRRWMACRPGPGWRSDIYAGEFRGRPAGAGVGGPRVPGAPDGGAVSDAV